MTERETYIGDDDLISKFMCKETGKDKCDDNCDCRLRTQILQELGEVEDAKDLS